MTGLGGCVQGPPTGGIASGPARIEKLQDLPPEQVGEMLPDSEAAGSRIVRRLVSDWDDRTNRFDRPGEALFGAWMAGRLVGVCGLNVDPYAGDDRVGRVRHLYVLTSVRRHGVGRQLVAHVVESARSRFDRLHLRTNNEAAARLYVAMGFRPGGEEAVTHALELGRRAR